MEDVKDWLKQNPIIAGAIIIGVSIMTYAYISKNQSSDSELFKLNADCTKLAHEFVKNNSSEINESGNTIKWEFLHSIYNTKKKSCFGEFSKFVYQNYSKRSFGEYYIYDLLKNVEIIGYTYNDSSGYKFDSDYFNKYNNARKEIFGLSEFKKIDAEKEQQGNIKVVRTGLEKDFKYSNFSNGRHSREDYLVSLSRCLEIAEEPVLVHVNAFSDLPSENELQEFHINNLMSRERLKELQFEDKESSAIKEFKEGKIKILFTTKCSRGVDFPGDECKSIVFTKYPNPNVQDAFWKILYKTKQQHYWDFYKDKAERELLQKVYRGLRFKEDKINLLSPDSRVLEFFERNRNL